MSVFIVQMKKNAPLEVQKVFKEIFKHAVVVALNGKHGEKNSVRIWARGVEGDKELSDDQKKMYLLSAYGRASDYDNDRTTFATFSGSWILDDWNGLQVIGRITPASSGPVISYGDEESPSLDISVPEGSQLPQFDVARAKIWEREQLIKETHPVAAEDRANLKRERDD